MNQRLIRAIDLSKEFVIYPDSLSIILDAIGIGRLRERKEVFKGLSFDVHGGEITAVIGENGSGKTTLLKIMGGLLAPSSGRVEKNGLTTSYVRLGHGLDSRLTGRENIEYASRGVLSQEKRASFFSEVIAFVDLGAYIDRKVETYSSGMYSRLAFALAYAKDADVFISDEVLAVGDARFNLKCFDLLTKNLRNGKIYLLATHDLDSVKRYATQVIWIRDGGAVVSSDVAKVVREYQEHCDRSTSIVESSEAGHSVDLLEYSITINNASAESLPVLVPGDRIQISVNCTAVEYCEYGNIGLTVENDRGIVVLHVASDMVSMDCCGTLGPGDTVTFRFAFMCPDLASGYYWLSWSINDITNRRQILRKRHEHRLLLKVGYNLLVKSAGICHPRDLIFKIND